MLCYTGKPRGRATCKHVAHYRVAAHANNGRGQQNTMGAQPNLAAQWPQQLKGYKQKACGPVPNAALLAQAVAINGGKGTGNANTFALAMYLRPAGATQAQVVAAVGGPNLNVWRNLHHGKAKGGQHVTATQTRGAGNKKCYHVALKAKGKAKQAAKPKATEPQAA